MERGLKGREDSSQEVTVCNEYKCKLDIFSSPYVDQ
jgi:hypothetical protein